MKVAVLQDPAHPYAEEFIRILSDDMGLATVALWTTPGSRRRYGGRYPILRSRRVRAEYAAAAVDPDRIVSRLRADGFEPCAFVPFVETGVAVAGALARSTGLSWGTASDWAMFRDKYAVKSRIAHTGGIRMNRFARVADAESVIEELEKWDCDRFVLKPNDGFGNSRIGVFDAGVGRADLQDYFSIVGAEVLMEEFLAGDEFYVNGHADQQGEPHVFLIGRYVRRAMNGRHNIEVGATTLRSTDPLFEVLADYTKDVVRALGLKRSPFHAEVMLAGDDPCLIEIAARLSGGGDAFTMRRAHGGSVDPFRIAAHHYQSAAPTPIEPGWDSYNSGIRVQVTGASDRDGRLWSVPRMTEAERLPGFVTWLARPRLGQRLTRTKDLGSSSYSAELCAGSQEEALPLFEQVESLMEFNPSASRSRTVVRRGRALVSGAHGRIRDIGVFPRRLRWIREAPGPGRPDGG